MSISHSLISDLMSIFVLNFTENSFYARPSNFVKMVCTGLGTFSFDNNRELKHRRFGTTDGNRTLNFSLLVTFSRHRDCNVKPESSTRAFPVRGMERNQAKKGTILLSVAVRGSRTSVLRLPNREQQRLRRQRER